MAEYVKRKRIKEADRMGYGGYHNNNVTGDFEYEKKQLMNVADDLCYGEEVIKKLKNAKSSVEMDCIMKGARNAGIIKDLKKGKRAYV